MIAATEGVSDWYVIGIIFMYAIPLVGLIAYRQIKDYKQYRKDLKSPDKREEK